MSYATKLDELADGLPEHVRVGVRETARVTGQCSLDQLVCAVTKSGVCMDPEPWLESALLLTPEEYDTFEAIVKEIYEDEKANRPKIRRRRS